MTNWGGLPPIDVAGWAEYQRKRLQQQAAQRIAAAGAVASDWQSAAQRQIEQIGADLSTGWQSALGAQTAMDATSAAQTAAEAGTTYAQPGAPLAPEFGPLPSEGAPSPFFTAPETGTPEGEATIGRLAQTATEQTPGGSFFPNLARTVTGDPSPMTADTPLQNLGTMGLLGLQNVGAPLPGGRAINPGLLTEAATRAAVEAVPGGQTSVLDGATIPNYVPFLGGQTLTKDTPVLGGLTTPDEAIPFATGILAGDPEDILRTGNQAVGLADEAGGWATAGAERIARLYGGAGVDPNLGLRGRPADAVALGRRAFRPPTGPSAPGAGMTPDQLAQRVKDAEEAIYTWQGGETAEVDHVAKLLTNEAPQLDWNALIGSGRVDPDALNRALVAYGEEGLSEADALQRALGSPEEQLAGLQIGEAAGGVRQPSGVTKGLLKKAIEDLAERDPATGAVVRPFVTGPERGAFNAGRNAPPNPAGKKNAWEYVDKNGKSWWLSTPYEVLFAKQLDQNPDVAYWAQSAGESVMETTVRHGGEPKVFTPDFIVVGTDGRVQVVEIKNIGAYRQVPWRVPEKLREAEEFFNSKGVGFSIFVEDQLGRGAAKGARPEDFLPDANGRMGVVNGFYVANEQGTKVGRFDPEAAREELAKRLREAGGAWDLNELGYLSGSHPATQEEYDELLASTHWPAWSGRMERGKVGRPDRGPALITPDQRRKIIAAGVGGSHPAEGGYGRPYEFAEPVRPEQGGYDPRWTAHRAYAEFNERQRRKGAPTIAVDAVEAYPQMLRRVPRVREEWAKQVADGQHGLTLDPHTGEVGVPGRYAVSIAPGAGLELPGKPEDIHPDRLAMWMSEVSPTLRLIPNARVGFWYDSTKDITYVDVSIGLNSRKQAEELGKRMSQYAIFDSVAKKDVDLVYPGLPAGAVPPPPSRQEQADALIQFGRQRGRPQPGRAGAPGPGAGAVPGRTAGAPGADRGRGAGRLGRGGPGAAAPGPAGDAGPGGPGLGSLEQGGVGQADAPFGTYPPPVPYAGAGESAADSGGRAAAGAAGAPGAGRGLGQEAAQGGLGGVAGFAYTPEEEDGEEPTLEERLQRGGTLAIGGAVASKRGRRLAAQAARDAGKVKLSDIPTILGSVPLMAPSSLGANFTGGMARTLERVVGQAAELRPIDAATDLLAMLREVPGASSRLWKNARRGPTEAAQGALGAPVTGDLSTRGGLVPGVLTSGVRANSATDQFWRDLNEAGARAVAGRRGLGTAQANRFATRAGDFATFTGSNSAVATKLTEMKQALKDPNANAGDKAIAGIVTAMAPYIMMPERLLRATVLAPPEQLVGFAAALKRGDKAAAREAAGRFAASTGALVLMKHLYDEHNLTGDPPQDANERRRREAQGEQWNTFNIPGVGRVPTRYFGSLGMQASVVASVMDAADRAEKKGADPGAVWEARANELAGWSLDNSYLSDLTDFLGAVSERRFGDAARQTAAGVLSRPVAPLAGIANAADPYERQTEDFPSTVAARTGLRFLAPTRVDPTTGEDQRRRGSGFSRYFGERGSEQTDEAQELARLELQPSVLNRTEEYEGAKQTPAQRRVAQRALGSETGRAVRAAMATGAYREADDATKKSLLQGALREASRLADIKAGEQVARSPAQQAQRAWDAIPKYQGVDGTPDEIRRQNAAIAAAKAAQAAAKQRGDAALDRWERENPALADLAATKPQNPRYLALDKEDIEAQYKVQLP